MANPLPDAVLDQLFRSARTYNGYLDKPVTETQLRTIYELLKMGPTSANVQPLRITWCVSQDAKEKLAACASDTNGPKIRKAPVTAILAMDMTFYDKLPQLFPHNPDARGWFVSSPALAEATAFRNSSLQGAYFIMAARALGLDTGPMSGFNNAAVDEAFFAGTSVKSNFISTVGYGDPSTIFNRLPRPSFEETNSLV
jgi:3-hydroxypropanoate dehydrogenase